MQVRLLIGRNAGEVVEMAYDRAVANRELGHVEFVRDSVVERLVIDTPGSLSMLEPHPKGQLDVAPAAPVTRPRGRPRTRA